MGGGVTTALKTWLEKGIVRRQVIERKSQCQGWIDFLLMAGQKSPGGVWNNKSNYYYCCWLETRTRWWDPVTEDIDCLDCRTWKNQTAAKVKVPFPPTAFISLEGSVQLVGEDLPLMVLHVYGSLMLCCQHIRQDIPIGTTVTAVLGATSHAPTGWSLPEEGTHIWYHKLGQSLSLRRLEDTMGRLLLLIC